MFYFIIFIIGIFGTLLETIKTDTKDKESYYILFSSILWFLAAFRYETGGDWTSYTDSFKETEGIFKVLNQIAPNFSENYMEIGYKLVASFYKQLGANIQYVFFTIATINSLLLYSVLIKYSEYPILSLVIYYCTLYFSLDFVAVRQALAVMIFFVSIKYILKKSFVKYFLCILLGALFHRSILLLLPLYFILSKQTSRKTSLCFFLFSIVIYSFNLNWIKETLLSVSKFVGGAEGKIIEMYVTSPTYGVSRVLSIGTIINVILFTIYFFNYNQMAKNRYFKIFFNLFLANIFVYFICFEVIEFANRLRYYFLISNVILLPCLLKQNMLSIFRFSFLFFCQVFSFSYARNIFLEQRSAAAYNPYQNYIIHILFNTESDGGQRLEQSDEELIKSRERE